MASRINGNPQLSWVTVLSMAAFAALLFGGSWAVSQTQFAGVQRQVDETKTEIADLRRSLTAEKRFDELLKRVDAIEARQFDLLAKSARNPVESGELTALIGATDKRLDVVQAQIADINRQIAAAILLGPSGDDRKKALVPP